MTEFAGEECNIGIAHSLALANRIIGALEGPDDGSEAETLDVAVAAYDKEMFVRAEKIRKLTADNMADFMDERPMGLWWPNMMKRLMEQGGGLLWTVAFYFMHFGSGALKYLASY